MNKVFHLMASAKAAGPKKGEVMVYSAIGSYKWDENDPTVTSNDFDKELKALGDVDEITVRINSPGGIVHEAVAIRSMLMKHRAAKNIEIEGCCDSAATIIACMPGARVRMAKGGEYMIHRCSGGAWGNADKMLSAYNSMKQTDQDISEIYAERTGKTAEECLKLMEAETWYGAKEAMAEGFVDEIIGAGDGEDLQLVACAVSAECMETMKSCYSHVPDWIPVKEPEEEPEQTEVSNAKPAVAAGHATENILEEEQNMPELRDATAEMLQAENPGLVQEIARNAMEAERTRIAQIDKLTPKGARYAEMAKKAKDEGTSAQDYFMMILEAQDKAGNDYLEARSRETAPANRIGAGDPKDVDGKSEEDELKAFAEEMKEYMTKSNSKNESMF